MTVTVVVPPGASPSLLALAAPLGDRVVALAVVTVPPGQSVSEGALEAQARRARLDALAAQAGVEADAVVRVGYDLWAEVLSVAAETNTEVLVVDATLAGERGLDSSLARSPCDVLVAAAFDPAAVRRILVPARGGPHARRAAEIAAALAARWSAATTLLHVAGTPDDPEAFREVAASAAGAEARTMTGSPGEVIALEAPRYDLVVMGATSETALGPIPQRLTDAGIPVVVVKTREPLSAWLRRRAGTAWPSAVVDKWFAQSTFDAREFADVGRLVELKRRHGVTISLGLPTLNEAETIAAIIVTLREALVERHPLLDEIVVIDSGSTDRTTEIAASLGVPTYQHAEILSQYGSFRGKGEALWKSLYVLRGDIVAWVDTDVRDMGPHFVYGLVGPLLREPRLQYVKGYYRRPIHVGGAVYETGGGRVTELVARPLFNLFYPELSGVIQPLAGEYAGRRRALERLPFFTGYGVETGLLIDLLGAVGLDAIAQVNLEQRHHRNQPLPALSMMAFAIIQVVVRRLEDRAALTLLEEINRTMKLIRSAEGHLSLELRAIEDVERPPIADLPEYRARHG